MEKIIKLPEVIEYMEKNHLSHAAFGRKCHYTQVSLITLNRQSINRVYHATKGKVDLSHYLEEK